jgi:hypothetical protein
MCPCVDTGVGKELYSWEAENGVLVLVLDGVEGHWKGCSVEVLGLGNRECRVVISLEAGLDVPVLAPGEFENIWTDGTVECEIYSSLEDIGSSS